MVKEKTPIDRILDATKKSNVSPTEIIEAGKGIIKQDKISNLGERAVDKILKWVVEGLEVPEITRLLKEKYNLQTLTKKDVYNFLQSNNELMVFIENSNSMIAKKRAELTINHHRVIVDSFNTIQKMENEVMDIEAGEDAKEVSLKAGALKGLTYAKLHLLKMQALLDGKLKGDGPNVQMNILQQFNDKTIAIQRKISGIDIDIPTTIVEGESKT